jgi:hypothetical protein
MNCIDQYWEGSEHGQSESEYQDGSEHGKSALQHGQIEPMHHLLEAYYV